MRSITDSSSLRVPTEAEAFMPEMTHATGPHLQRRSGRFTAEAGRTVIVALGAVVLAGVTACSVSLPRVLSSPTIVGNTSSKPTAAPSTSEQSKLFADDFRGVCQGATVSRATAYD